MPKSKERQTEAKKMRKERKSDGKVKEGMDKMKKPKEY
jgi:hypothetical protein